MDRLRQLIARGGGGAASQRRVTRREREATQRRLLIIGIGVAAVLLVGILATGAIYQYLYLPNQALATVNGHDISRSDYWKLRKLSLLNQISQYNQLAQFAQGQQASQYQQLAQQAQQQLGSVESDPVDATTLGQMVDDQILLQRMNQLGVSISDADVDKLLAEFFAPVPLASPTPTLPIDPTAEAWATATAQAQASATPSPAASPPATPEATGTATEPAATPHATPSPAASPSATPAPSATPNPEQIQATATATFNEYKKNVLDQAGMSLDDFKRLVARPELAREKVTYELGSKIAPRQEQVHAAHILVATEDAAKQIEQQLQDGGDFAALAKEKSADSGTAPNGGDLGWFPRGVMVKPFEDVAFSLKPGEISQPVHSEFGWHIIKVFEHEQDRPLTVEMINTLRGQAYSKWLDQERGTSTIEWHASEAAPSPTPVGQFTPPPDAPPTPTPTPMPSPPATPGASPEASPTP